MGNQCIGKYEGIDATVAIQSCLLKAFFNFFFNCASLQLGEVIYLNQGFSIAFFFIVVTVIVNKRITSTNQIMGWNEG